jgi:hypothetical protein
MNDEADEETEEVEDPEGSEGSEADPTMHCFTVAGHSGEESLRALRVAQELSNILGPIYKHLFEVDPTEPEAVKGVFMLIDLLVKLYSVGFHMGMDAESGYLEKYERLLEGVKGTYKRHELQ